MAESSREEIAKLEALYASNPAGRVFTHLADAYRKAGELERARGILEEGLAQHPGYASAHVVLGRVLMDLQEGNEAINAFQRVLELDPHNMVALQSLAELTRASGRHEEALRYYQELRQHDPGSTEVEEAIAELTGAAARPAEPEVAETQQSEFGEISIPEANAAPAWEPEPEVSSPPAAAADAGATFDWEHQPEPERHPASEFTAADASEGAEDIDLDWLSSGADTGREFGELSGVPSPRDEADERSFDFADEIGDIGSLSAASVEEKAEPTPFEGFTLEAPSLDIAEPPRAEEPGGELLTETIAELYASQGLYDRAADVYRSLLRERPGEPGLKEKLREVEALDRGERPELAGQVPGLPAWEPISDETSERAEFVSPQENEEPDMAAEQAEAWLAGGAGTAESAPTPYAWAEQASEPLTNGGPPISDYFNRLLAWRPKSEAGVAESTFAPEAETVEAGSEAAEEPLLLLEESAPAAEEPVFESTAVSPPAAEPAAKAPEAMPWERPVEESYGRPSIAPTPHDEAVEAFDEWFGPAEDSAASEPSAPTAPATEDTVGEGDDDDDLEMFRSWLQSLKK